MIKRIIQILILIIFLSPSAFALTQSGKIKYDDCMFAFKTGDEKKFLSRADANLLLSIESKTAEDKNFYLDEAMRYYFLLEKINPASVDAHIGLARIYDEKHLDKLAIEHFYKALNIDKNCPRIGLHFGNYYFKRRDYVSALSYYEKAYSAGYAQNYYLNLRLATLYEKLADIEHAKSLYKRAFSMNPVDNSLYEKILNLEKLDYSRSQYYLFKKS